MIFYNYPNDVAMFAAFCYQQTTLRRRWCHNVEIKILNERFLNIE